MKAKKGEHPYGDAGQLILLGIFLVVWVGDSFFLHKSTFLSDYVPQHIRLVFFGLALVVAFPLLRSGHAVIPHERGPGSVITAGAFRYVRHPLYLSGILTYLGLTVLTVSLFSLVLLVVIIIFYDYIAGYEERFLEDQFGEKYRAYKEKTGKWLPKVRRNSRHMTYALVLAIAAVSCLVHASCEGDGRWSEEWEARFETFQPSDNIMNILGIEPGMVVGEIGAGNGRFAVKVAARVGPTGRVYANDIDPKAISFMERRCRRDRISNMEVIRGRVVEPGFPEGALDLVYLINTYDDLSDPVTLLRNTRPCLEQAGRLAVIVYDPAKLTNHQGHAVPKNVVVDQCGRAGFTLVHMDTTLVYDNIYIFEPAH